MSIAQFVEKKCCKRKTKMSMPQDDHPQKMYRTLSV